MLNCKYLGWVNQKTQHGGEIASLKSWKQDGSVMRLAPVHCFSSRACAPDLMGTWRSLQREVAGMLQAENPCHCENKRGDVTPSVHHSPAQSSSCCATYTSLTTAGQTSPPSQLYPTASWEQGFPVPSPSWACRKTFPAVLLSCGSSCS